MDWIAEHWEVIVAIVTAAYGVWQKLAKGKTNKVVEALVQSIERADAADVKALAKDKSARAGVGPLLAKIVTKLTEGEKR
jgi:hypothetical protein